MEGLAQDHTAVGGKASCFPLCFLAAVLALGRLAMLVASYLQNLRFLVCPVIAVWHSSGSPLVLICYGPLVLQLL